MSNKSDGTRFERKFAEILYMKGFWVLNIPDGKNGQPFDIIAVRDRQAYAFDCKACEGHRFDFSRIEENQRNAFAAWESAGNNPAMLAIQFPEGIYMMYYEDIRRLEERGVRSIARTNIRHYGTELGQWLKGWKA